MSDLCVHITAVERAEGRAWGLATRFGFELLWQANQSAPDEWWEVDVPMGQSTTEEPVFEIVTDDDFKVFRSAVNRELQRILKERRKDKDR